MRMKFFRLDITTKNGGTYFYCKTREQAERQGAAFVKKNIATEYVVVECWAY